MLGYYLACKERILAAHSHVPRAQVHVLLRHSGGLVTEIDVDPLPDATRHISEHAIYTLADSVPVSCTHRADSKGDVVRFLGPEFM